MFDPRVKLNFLGFMKLLLFGSAEGPDVDLCLFSGSVKQAPERIWASLKICVEILGANTGRNFKARGLPFLLCEFRGLADAVGPTSEIESVMLAEALCLADTQL